MPSTAVSGTSAREEGLRTLTSPRREASLFKLGRKLRFPANLFGQTGSRVPAGSRPALVRLVDVATALPVADGRHCVTLAHWGCSLDGAHSDADRSLVGGAGRPMYGVNGAGGGGLRFLLSPFRMRNRV